MTILEAAFIYKQTYSFCLHWICHTLRQDSGGTGIIIIICNGNKVSYLVSNDIKQPVIGKRIKLFLKARNKNHTYIYFSLISKGSLKNM